MQPSADYRFFRDVFENETAGPGREAAENAVAAFKKLPPDERQLALEWIYEAFKQGRYDHWNPVIDKKQTGRRVTFTPFIKELYLLQVIEYAKDYGFLPFVIEFHKKMKQYNRKRYMAMGESGALNVPASAVPMRFNFSRELAYCRRVIKGLRREMRI